MATPELRLTYRTQRWNAHTTLRFTPTASGWDLRATAIHGAVEPDGSPFLVSNLQQDNVKYPKGLDDFVGFVWRQLQADEIDGQQAQVMFDELGAWITQCEQGQPVWPGWNR